MKLLLPDGELALVTTRCLRDYIDQIRPGCLSLNDAWKDMQRLVSQHGTVTLQRPEWMTPPRQDRDEWSGVPRWVVVGDVAVLVQYAADDPDMLLATTVVTRGAASSEVRRIKNERAANRRRHRKVMRTDGPGKVRSKKRRERRDQLERESDSRRDAP